MTFPTIASTATSSQTTNTTTHTVTMPASVAAGDLLVVAIALDARPIVSGTIPDNWTEVVATADAGDNVALRIYWKTATGSEGSTQTINTDVGQTSAHRAWRITGASPFVAIEAALTQGPSAGTAPDPPSLNPTNWDVEDTLWIAVAANDNGTVTTSGFPTSYTNTGNVNAGDGTDGCSIEWGTRENATASENPSAFTISSSEEWATATLAIKPQGLVEFVAVGTKSAGSATATSIAYPSGISSGRMILAGRSGWRSDITMSNESGWTNTAELGGGTGTSVDAHTTKVRVDRLEASGSESGSVTFDQSGSTNPGCLGIMLNYAKVSGYTWDVATSTGDDATHGTNRSVTGSSNVSFQAGDVLVAFASTDTDTNLASFSSPALTASGITFGTTTRRSPASAGVTTGDDGNIEVFDATVSSGTGTVAPALAFTTTTNQCGPVAFVRLRAVSAGTTAAAGNATATGTANNPAPTVALNAGTGTSTGTANNPAPSTKPVAGTGTATGTANGPTISTATTPATATAAGVVDQSAQAVTFTAGTAAASGAANPAVITVAPSPATATGTAVAESPALAVITAAGTASAAGVAGDPAVHTGVDVAAGTATASGVADDPSVSSSSNVSAGTAAATGTAAAPSIAIAPTTTDIAGTGTATAPSPAVTFTAGTATATGSASNPTAVVTAAAGSATGTGAAQGATGKVTTTPAIATAVGVADNPAIVTGSNAVAQAELATGTGTAPAPNPAVNLTAGTGSTTGSASNPVAVVAPAAGTGSGGGTAFNAAVQTSSSTTAPAGAVSATGAANPAIAGLATTASSATATGVAFDTPIGLAAAAATGAGSGQAFNLAVVTFVTAFAGHATATAATQPTAQLVGVFAGHAVGSGFAESPNAFGDVPDPNPVHVAIGEDTRISVGGGTRPTVGEHNGIAFADHHRVTAVAGASIDIREG